MEGEVDDVDGHPEPGVRVIVLPGSILSSLFTTDAQGKFRGRVPPGATSFQADDAVTRSQVVTATIGEAPAEVTLVLPPQGKLTLHIRDAQGTRCRARRASSATGRACRRGRTRRPASFAT